MSENIPVHARPSKRDLHRSGVVIFSVGVVLAVIGARFRMTGQPNDINAAWFFWVVGAILSLTGIGIFVTADRFGVPEDAPLIDEPID